MGQRDSGRRLAMKRFEVWLVCLDPVVGSEIRKTRPAIIVSPDELNEHLNTAIVVPLTSGQAYPFRVATKVQGKVGVAAVDQIRTVDKRRLIRRLTTLDRSTAEKLLAALDTLFAP
jgi:mRNA interferase MazF